MLFSGVIHLPNQDSQVSPARLMNALDKDVFDIQQAGNQITFLYPGMDIALLNTIEKFSIPVDTEFWRTLAKPLWDELTFHLNQDGSISYALNYWSGFQIILHGLINFLIILNLVFKISPDLNFQHFLAMLFLANSLPILMSHCTSYIFIRNLTRKLLAQQAHRA